MALSQFSRKNPSVLLSYSGSLKEAYNLPGGSVDVDSIPRNSDLGFAIFFNSFYKTASGSVVYDGKMVKTRVGFAKSPKNLDLAVFTPEDAMNMLSIITDKAKEKALEMPMQLYVLRLLALLSYQGEDNQLNVSSILKNNNLINLDSIDKLPLRSIDRMFISRLKLIQQNSYIHDYFVEGWEVIEQQVLSAEQRIKDLEASLKKKQDECAMLQKQVASSYFPDISCKTPVTHSSHLSSGKSQQHHKPKPLTPLPVLRQHTSKTPPTRMKLDLCVTGKNLSSCTNHRT